MGLLEFLVWIWGITWAGIVAGLFITRKKDDSGQ